MHGDGVSHCYYAEDGNSYATVENQDMGLFRLDRSGLSNNSTEVSRGIIFGIIYTFA